MNKDSYEGCLVFILSFLVPAVIGMGIYGIGKIAEASIGEEAYAPAILITIALIAIAILVLIKKFNKKN